MAKGPLLQEAEAYGYMAAQFWDEKLGDGPEDPAYRLVVRGGEHDPRRRVTEDCLQQIHLNFDLAWWGRA